MLPEFAFDFKLSPPLSDDKTGHWLLESKTAASMILPRSKPGGNPTLGIRVGKAKYAGEGWRRKVGGLWRAYPEDFQFNGERAATFLTGQDCGIEVTDFKRVNEGDPISAETCFRVVTGMN